MADAFGVDVGERAEHLVGVEFDEQDGHGLLHAVVVLHHAVHRLGDEVHHDVQVELLLLRG